MNQTTFVDPSAAAPVDPAPANTGNGTMSTPVVSSATLTETLTVTCTVPGGCGVGQFSVVGSVSGALGTATSNTEFVDAAQKVRFTLTAGGTPWAVGDNFTSALTAGAILNETNFDSFSDPILKYRTAIGSGWKVRTPGSNQTGQTLISTTIDLGTLEVNDIIQFCAQGQATNKTATGGIGLTLQQSAGSGAVESVDGGSSYQLNEHNLTVNQVFSMTMAGAFRVTTQGTVTLEISIVALDSNTFDINQNKLALGVYILTDN